MSRIKIETATLDEIWDECESVLGTQFGHNMIQIMCQVVEKRFGKNEAQELYDVYQK